MAYHVFTTIVLKLHETILCEVWQKTGLATIFIFIVNSANMWIWKNTGKSAKKASLHSVQSRLILSITGTKVRGHIIVRLAAMFSYTPEADTYTAA